jgi:uracil-DNA glycosylase
MLSELVNQIRTERNLKPEDVPGFDPLNGNQRAKYLFLLEAPGPKAIKTGRISFDNPDPAAKNFKRQLDDAGINREEIVIWNIVPWYIGNADRTAIRAANSDDVEAGKVYLKPLVALLPDLKCIVLVGSVARKAAHMLLSRITTARIVCCHHPSARVVNLHPEKHQENIELFRFLKTTTLAGGS